MVILWGVPLNVRDTTTLLRLHSQFSTSATNTAPILHCMSQLLIPSAEVDIGAAWDGLGWALLLNKRPISCIGSAATRGANRPRNA